MAKKRAKGLKPSSQSRARSTLTTKQVMEAFGGKLLGTRRNVPPEALVAVLHELMKK
jgi:hypothetical protein